MAAAVNRPTDYAQKEKDINQKLQFYGIYSAFANGKAPSNKQIDVALNSALASKALSSPDKRLSEDGRKLVADVKEVINQAKHLLLTKNQGNLLQDFIWQCQLLDGGNAALPGAPVDKATAKQHGNEALDGLKTLGRLVLSNGQFRKLLKDAQVLARDMAGDAAQKAANKVNPSEDELNQIDQPAEDDTWHDVPDLSRENVKGQMKSTYNKQKPFDAEEAKQAAQQGADAAQEHPTEDNQEAGKVGASNALGNLKDKAQENVPDETQDRAKNAKNAAVQRSKNYYNKKIPQERRDQTIWRLKKMIAEIQGHEDYQQAIETLLSLAETYGGHANNVASQATGTVKGAHADNSLQTAETDLKTLIERFANSTSTDDLFDSLNQIYRDADRDPELKDWFKSMDKYVRRCLQEKGYILQDSSTEEWNRIYDKGDYLLRERYRDHTDRILDEFNFLGEQFDKDPQNKAFAEAINNLFLDLGKDSNGKPEFKPHLIKDLTDVIIPGIFANTRYVPIPRIEVSDPQADIIVENLVIESDNLFPNMMEFGNDSYLRMGRRQASSKLEQKFMIGASGIQMDLRDVAYYIKRKQGFPTITDKGVMDIILAGEGFSFKLAARNAQKSDRTHFVVVDTVVVDIKNLKINIKQSNHKLLFKIAKSLLLKVMRPIITKVIEKQIKDAFVKADEFAYGIHQDAMKAVDAAKDDPENAPGIFQQYVNAYQKGMMDKKEKAKDKTSNTTVNVAMTKQDSIFKNISLPGGISTKATEYKQLAAKGDKWESPVFGIGSARESTNIPNLTPVTRKPHSTASGGVRGGNLPHDNVSSNFTPSDTAAARSTQQGSGFSSSTQQGSGYPSSTTPAQGFSSQVDQAFEPSKSINTAPTSGVTNGSANVGNTGGASFYSDVTQR